jgi:Glycosyl transferases group 1
MRILSFNQSWLADELRELGHEVVTCGHNPSLQVQIPKRVITIQEVLHSLSGFSPDLLLFLDDSMPGFLVSGLDTCDIPRVLYSVDTHHHWQAHTLIAPLFDHVLVAQHDYLHLFEKVGTPTTWFPVWPLRHLEPHPLKKFPAAFVGTLDPKLNPRRVDFFSALSKRIPIHVTSGDYAKIFPDAEIVVNQTVKGDLNFRIFEAMMCGACVLTERTDNGLFDLFRDGEHLVTYERDNVDQVVEKFEALRGQPKLMRDIAHAGREVLLGSHTSMHRAIAFDRIVRKVVPATQRPERHYVSMMNNAHINRILGELGQPACVYAAGSGLLAAEEALRREIPPSEPQTTHLISTCGVFDNLTSSGAGAELIRRFYEKYPHNPLLAFARIHSMLEQGATSEAHMVAAQQFKLPPEQACAMALDIIPRIIRGEILLPPD